LITNNIAGFVSLCRCWSV